MLSVKAGAVLRAHYSMLKKGEVIFHQVLSIYVRIVAISIAGSLTIG
jgi:hypothetical protein